MKQEEQQVKVERTMPMSKMETRMGPDGTISDPTMFIRKNNVLPVLLRLSMLLLPAPLPESMVRNLQGTPEN